ncbi:MAG TPA: hypothetical protein VFT90_10475 [Chryseosolibacter sp.]|nr:hypothetical protein [Chryseosolibacter sp.]
MDTNSPLYNIAQGGFLLLTVIFLFLLISEFRKAMELTDWDPVKKKRYIRQLVISLVAWAVFVSVWSLSARMSDFSIFPFNLMPVILVPIVVAIIFISSKNFGEILRHIPPGNLIRLQSFRFFVEVLLWMLFIAELLPIQMTFEGRNWDILAGFSAPIIAVLAAKGRISSTAIVIWNIICLGLLVNIVVIAVLSTPSPWRAFMNEPANYIVTYFSISWLPGFLVPLAYYLHFMSIRQMSLGIRDWALGIRSERKLS